MLKVRIFRRPRHQDAFTLIEVLVALIVLSIGLLGLASLQLTGLRNNHAAYLRSQATMLASDITDRMRANRRAALKEDYDIALGAAAGSAADCESAACSREEMAAFDLFQWRTTVQQALSSGDSSVDVVPATGIATVVIQWDETRGAEAPIQFQIQTQL